MATFSPAEQLAGYWWYLSHNVWYGTDVREGRESETYHSPNGLATSFGYLGAWFMAPIFALSDMLRNRQSTSFFLSTQRDPDNLKIPTVHSKPEPLTFSSGAYSLFLAIIGIPLAAVGIAFKSASMAISTSVGNMVCTLRRAKRRHDQNLMNSEYLQKIEEGENALELANERLLSSDGEVQRLKMELEAKSREANEQINARDRRLDSQKTELEQMRERLSELQRNVDGGKAENHSKNIQQQAKIRSLELELTQAQTQNEAILLESRNRVAHVRETYEPRIQAKEEKIQALEGQVARLREMMAEAERTSALAAIQVSSPESTETASGSFLVSERRSEAESDSSSEMPSEVFTSETETESEAETEAGTQTDAQSIAQVEVQTEPVRVSVASAAIQTESYRVPELNAFVQTEVETAAVEEEGSDNVLVQPEAVHTPEKAGLFSGWLSKAAGVLPSPVYMARAAERLGVPPRVHGYIVKRENVNDMDKDGRSPIEHAVLLSDAHAVKKYRGLGAKIDQPDNQGFTAMHYAGMYPNEAVIEALIDGNKTERSLFVIPDDFGRTPLMYAVQHNNLAAAFELAMLTGAKGSMNYKCVYPDLFAQIDKDERNVLHHAALSKQYDQLAQLMAIQTEGISPLLEQTDQEGKTPLFYAIAPFANATPSMNKYKMFERFLNKIFTETSAQKSEENAKVVADALMNQPDILMMLNPDVSYCLMKNLFVKLGDEQSFKWLKSMSQKGDYRIFDLLFDNISIDNQIEYQKLFELFLSVGSKDGKKSRLLGLKVSEEHGSLREDIEALGEESPFYQYLKAPNTRETVASGASPAMLHGMAAAAASSQASHQPASAQGRRRKKKKSKR